MPQQVNPDARPIYIQHEIDDLQLTPDASRVLIHLSRRAGKDNLAFPSYLKIGRHCFSYVSKPNIKPDSLRRRAIRAVSELERKGLVKKETRRNKETGSYSTNHYRIVTTEEFNEMLKETKGE